MFEKQNPNIPGINVFSIINQNKIYTLEIISETLSEINRFVSL